MSAESLVQTVLDRLTARTDPPSGPARWQAPGVSELLALGTPAPTATRSPRRSVSMRRCPPWRSPLLCAIANGSGRSWTGCRRRRAGGPPRRPILARRASTRAGTVGPIPATSELECHGLAFAFRSSYNLEYHVPHELHAPLADVLAAPYVGDLKSGEPGRPVEAPLQLGHDLAALWAHLARSPVRVKADGPVYQRDVPKLLTALPALELHAQTTRSPGSGSSSCSRSCVTRSSSSCGSTTFPAPTAAAS